MRFGMRSASVLAASLVVSAAAMALDEPKDRPKPLEVGQEAPAFALKDKDGKERTLGELTKGGKTLALVFYRSADWCPFCRKQLAGLQADLGKIEEAGLKVVGISYDAPEVLRAASEKMKITFPLLSDPDSKVIDRYHVRNSEAKGKAQGVPNPEIFLVDGDGKIRARLSKPGYRERPTVDEILAAASKLKPE